MSPQHTSCEIERLNLLSSAESVFNVFPRSSVLSDAGNVQNRLDLRKGSAGTFVEKDPGIQQLSKWLGKSPILDGMGLEVASLNSTPSVNAIPYHKERLAGLSYLPEQYTLMSYKKGSNFTLMVAGMVGTGKTTFINTLFRSNLINTSTEIPKATSNITLHKYELVEEGFKLRLTLVDTPGIGNLIDNNFAWYPATKFIDDQFTSYMFQSEEPDRSKIKDNRVHCCLYFLNPSGSKLKPLDIDTMRALSKRVNLIPVIGKSDTFSSEELIKFKNEVRRTMKFNSIPICDFLLDEGLSDRIESVAPFAVVGSNTYYRNGSNKYVRGRKYKWGLVEVDNRSHCDFADLRNVLMGENLLDLIFSTETHYENYREHLLAHRLKLIYEYERRCLEELPNDGIDQYFAYHKIGFKEIMDSLECYDPEVKRSELRSKEAFNQVIALQERRFKEWKMALVDKQNFFNDDIEKYHKRVLELQKAVNALEKDKITDESESPSSIEKDITTLTPIEPQSSQNSVLEFN